MRPTFLRLSIAVLATAGLLAPPSAGSVDAATTYNWSAYLGGPRHDSFTADPTITPANAAHLVSAWSWTPTPGTRPGQPSGGLYASPTVYNHRIYIGSTTGDFYALDEATGRVLWKRFLGFQPAITCSVQGFVSTAAVATLPATSGTGTVPVVYVAAPDGKLYALDAASGSVRWSSAIAIPSTTKNDAFDWSSPTIVGNNLYVGFSSNCDNPFIRGGLALFDRTSGARLATYYGVPAGSLGGGVWTSAAANTSEVFVSTGSASARTPGDVNAFVRLNPTSLTRVAGWTVPLSAQTAGDSDFGSSPMIFKATIGGTSVQLVGTCNKDGIFYTFKTGSLKAPFWQSQLGVASSDGGSSCLAGGTFDGTRLFLAADETTIGGVDYQGSLRELDPATGRWIWQLGLPANVLGTPSENGAGVIAVATHDYIPAGLTNAAYLVNASTGAILATFNHNNAKEFAQPIFADQFLLLTTTNTIFAYHP